MVEVIYHPHPHPLPHTPSLASSLTTKIKTEFLTVATKPWPERMFINSYTGMQTEDTTQVLQILKDAIRLLAVMLFLTEWPILLQLDLSLPLLIQNRLHL